MKGVDRADGGGALLGLDLIHSPRNKAVLRVSARLDRTGRRPRVLEG
jgi:hypothetical protein